MMKKLANKFYFKLTIFLTFVIVIYGIVFVTYNALEDKRSHAVDSPNEDYQSNIEDELIQEENFEKHELESPTNDEGDDIEQVVDLDDEEPEETEEIENKTINEDENILDPEDSEEEKEIDIGEKFKEGKVAYLTFDDGPSLKVTPMVLEILEDRGIKATFFVIGSMAEENPHILKRVYDSGHVLGNHTYSHIYSYLYKNTRNFGADILKWEEAIKGILGQDFSSNILRFPGGSFHRDKKYIMTANKLGYEVYDWNVINGDGEMEDPSPKMLVKRFKETIVDKKNPIILMHDTDAKMSTVESLEEILDYLIDEGYVFDTLNNFSER